MKVSGKIRVVSLNNVSKKLFDFDLNIFHYFKDHFFKVLVIDAVDDDMPLMLNRDREPCFLFYWESNPTRFKSYDKDLLTFVDRVDKAILAHLPASLDV